MSILNALSFGFGRKLPVILQTEAAECGLACIAMVLGYFGTRTDLSTLRQRHSLSLKGADLGMICNIAEQEALGFRALRLELNELTELKRPAILHWDLNHFVVLKGFQGKKVVIHDPATGISKLSLSEVSQKFTGVALELWPNPSFVPKVEKQKVSITQLIGQVKGFIPALTNVLLISFALEIFSLVNPLFMQWVVDHVLISKDSDLLATLAIGFLVVYILNELFTVARAWILLTLNTTVKVQWESNIFSHLLKLPIKYFESRNLGDLVSRAESSKHIQETLSTTFVTSVFDGVFAVVAFILMLLYNVQLAMISLLAVAIYVLIRVIWYKPLYGATEEHIIREATLEGHFLESLRGVRAVKIFGRQLQRLTTWQSLLINETNAELKVSKLGIVYDFIRDLLSGVFQIIIIYMGAKTIMAGQMTVGMLTAFIAYRGQFDTRITQLIDAVINLKMLKIQAERLSDIILTEPEPVILHKNKGKKRSIPDIKIDEIAHRYADYEPFVLEDLSFTIKAGESVAIVGASGSGKSTLVHLLLGTYQASSGNIYIDKVPLDKYGLQQWRKLLGVVMQDDTLFAGSIAANIAFFDSKPDVKRIEYCAKLAAIHNDIEMMPMAYQTLVGDMGTVLSGGQKQRVLLARALYKKPKILILDEATSHLDLMHEELVNAAIAALKMTRILIAHRPDTIRRADRVIELHEGQVAFDGTPDAFFEHINYKKIS